MGDVIRSVSATPSTFAAGNFPLSTMADGPGFSFVWIPTFDSTNPAYSGFTAFAATTDNGGLWCVERRVRSYDQDENFVENADEPTWSAGQPMRVTLHLAPGVNASSLSLSGATTGNGTLPFTYTGPSFTAGQTLGIGVYGGNNTFQLAGTIGDITSVVMERTAALSAAFDATSDLNVNNDRTAELLAAFGASSDLNVTHERSAALSAPAGASSSLGVVHERSAAIAVAFGAATGVNAVHERAAALTAVFGVSSSLLGAYQRAAAISVAFGASSDLTLIAQQLSVSLLVTFGASSDLTVVHVVPPVPETFDEIGPGFSPAFDPQRTLLGFMGMGRIRRTRPPR